MAGNNRYRPIAQGPSASPTMFPPLDPKRAEEEALRKPDIDPISAATVGYAAPFGTPGLPMQTFRNMIQQLMVNAPWLAANYMNSRIAKPFNYLRMANPQDAMYEPTISSPKE